MFATAEQWLAIVNSKLIWKKTCTNSTCKLIQRSTSWARISPAGPKLWPGFDGFPKIEVSCFYIQVSMIDKNWCKNPIFTTTCLNNSLHIPQRTFHSILISWVRNLVNRTKTAFTHFLINGPVSSRWLNAAVRQTKLNNFIENLFLHVVNGSFLCKCFSFN